MIIGQEIHFFDWFIIHFTENRGMAFGFEFGGKYGKYFLSIFRIIAIIGISFYWFKLTKTDVKKGIIYSVSLILAGAIGNMIDSAFYGMIFSDSYGQIATYFNGGYSSFYKERSLICFTFRYLMVIFLNGCHLLAETILYSSGQYLILQMHR